MTTPTRVQRQRTKGSKLPEGAVYIGRPSVYGNPIMVERRTLAVGRVWTVWLSDVGPSVGDHPTARAARAQATDLFELWLDGQLSLLADGLRQPLLDALPRLAGKTLACWCPTTDRCHGDVLLRRVGALAGQQ